MPVKNQKPPSPLLIKVCGLTRSDQIHKLISVDIQFLGFIFYEKSPRYVLNHLSPEEISQVGHRGKVGVFVNEHTDKIIEISEKAGLNFIQLHGDEDENFISELRTRLNPETGIIKAIRIGSHKTETDSLTKRLINYPISDIDYFLFDTDSEAFGGTGKTFDWQILNQIDIPVPYFLSGGISEDHIDDFKNLHQLPFALDINSRFETGPGIKNIKQIQEFKNAVQNDKP